MPPRAAKINLTGPTPHGTISDRFFTFFKENGVAHQNHSLITLTHEIFGGYTLEPGTPAGVSADCRRGIWNIHGKTFRIGSAHWSRCIFVGVYDVTAFDQLTQLIADIETIRTGALDNTTSCAPTD